MTIKGYNDVKNRGNYVLEFSKPSKIYFMDDCIICSNVAEENIKKTLYGSFTSSQDYTNNYTIQLPVCNECKNKIEMKTGLHSKSGMILYIFSIVGIILSIVLTMMFNSWIFGLSIAFTFVLFPSLAHNARMKNKIKLEKHVQIRLDVSNSDTLKISFSNKELAREIERVNLIEFEEEAKILEEDTIENKISQPVTESTVVMQSKVKCPHCMALVDTHHSYCINCGKIIVPDNF